MSQEFREIYTNIPAAVRGLFHDASKGLNAGEQLKAMGLSPRDFEVIPITPVETRKVARPLLEVLRLRKAKVVETVVEQFNLGDVVILVRLSEWTRGQTEQALRDLGADEVTYFPLPGEEGAIGAKVAPARRTEARPQA
jgi:hypothetical protein